MITEVLQRLTQRLGARTVSTPFMFRGEFSAVMGVRASVLETLRNRIRVDA
ncbi:hypothetical protein ACWGQ2_15690 [Arthrobacter sp. NPDC055585]